MTILVTIKVAEGSSDQRVFVQYYERLAGSWTPGKRGPIYVPPHTEQEFWVHSNQKLHVFEGDASGRET